jgi:Holliday junction DNA helicase RuvA
MIGRIRGILIEKQAPSLVVEAGGVGYELLAPMTTFYQLPDIGREITLFTHLAVREDAQTLYGFIDAEERRLFRSLIKVSGIGPKSALAILSGITPSAFVKYVIDSDITSLVRLPGIGKKTAERLVIEMRDRLDDWKLDFNIATSTQESSAIKDAISALVALGYRPQEAQKAVMQHKNKNLSSEELIRIVLKGLNDTTSL